MSTSFRPRPAQLEVLQYTGGMLGVSAVPGSGKTHTLAALAAQLLDTRDLEPDQEILIVTLVNSAVENFSARIAGLAHSGSLIPQLGYRVRTLHGLAHDIVREDPPRAGLEKRFSIVDETTSAAMMREAAHAWARAHTDTQVAYVIGSLGESQQRRVRTRDWPQLIENAASSFIRSAKNQRLTPDALRSALDQVPEPLPLASMGLEIYADYQRALVYRGAVDFDDLIRLAADLLETSAELLERLQHRWPYILEDEAQDSSLVQRDILSNLAGKDGNWVRVGDPNQAIFETFTTADPRLLRSFIDEHRSVDMPESGRCQPSIMNLANRLIEWTMSDHPEIEVRDALSPPLMLPTQGGDLQMNPPDDPQGVSLVLDQSSPQEEIQAVARSLQEWLPTHGNSTVAVLTATNDHAANMVRALQARGIKYRELLRSTSPTRAAAGALTFVLNYLAKPDSASKLAQAYRVWRRDWRENADRDVLLQSTARVLRRLKRIEDYIAPAAGWEESDALEQGEVDVLLRDEMSAAGREELVAELQRFRHVIARWHGATVLPIDQLILILAQDIFTSAADLALAHKLALVMGQLAAENPHRRLPELTPSLHEIAHNERRFIGFSNDDAGFDADAHKGTVVVSTVHKAKGLEWDRVYLLSINDYDFPSADPADHFMSEKWFVRDGLNFEAETLAQLAAGLSSSAYSTYVEGPATGRARLDYVRERLRLLYVGITRARRELVITWNTGRRGEAKPAVALAALHDSWQTAHS